MENINSVTSDTWRHYVFAIEQERKLLDGHCSYFCEQFSADVASEYSIIKAYLWVASQDSKNIQSIYGKQFFRCMICLAAVIDIVPIWWIVDNLDWLMMITHLAIGLQLHTTFRQNDQRSLLLRIPCCYTMVLSRILDIKDDSKPMHDRVLQTQTKALQLYTAVNLELGKLEKR